MFKECFRLPLILVVWVNEVGEGGDVSEVRDAIVLLMGSGKGNRSVMFRHCLDEGFEFFCDHMNVIGCLWVSHFVTDDGFAEGNSVVNLRLGRVYRFKDLNSNSFNLGGGRGKAREVFLDLTGCRVGFLLANISFQCRKGAAW